MISKFIAARKQIYRYRNSLKINNFYFNLTTTLFYFYKIKTIDKNLLINLRKFYAKEKIKKLNVIFKASGEEPRAMLGTLLGAVRNNGFAGRPSDIDYFLYSNNYVFLSKMLFKFGYDASIKTNYNVGKVLKVYGKGPPADIIIPELKIINNVEYLMFEKLHAKKTFFLKLTDYEAANEVRIYDTHVLVPLNAETYLTCWYGDDWMVEQKTRPRSNLIGE